MLGGIASGKSHVARLAARRTGAEVVVADALAGEALAEAAADGRIQSRLGPGLVDAAGTIDREAIADRVFGDPAALEALEALLHPPVLAKIQARLETHAAGEGADLLILDVPLLVEKGLDRRCDVLWFVRVPYALRMQRAAARGLTEAEVLRRERRQTPLDEKQAAADLVIDNADDPTPEIVRGLTQLGFVVDTLP